jgi:hypothetical protein
MIVLTDHDFDYRNVTGKLLYLEKSTRPDMSCTVHQCVIHCSSPKIQHTITVKRIGRYLQATKDKWLIMKPNQEGIEFWEDAVHLSEWNNRTALDDPNSARSRMGYIITYAGCPMHWTSKNQVPMSYQNDECTPNNKLK